MKKFIYTVAFIFVSQLVLAQTTTENYVKTTTYQVKTTDGTTNAVSSAPLQDEDQIQTVTYIDGMGRPYQSITKKGGGQRQDIVVPVIYDKLGRQTIEYLPYANESQSFGLATLGVRDQSVLLADIENYYATKYVEDQITSTTINAYSEKRFESSPLNRVLEQGAPGKDWIVKDNLDTDHTIKFEYHTNTLDTINPSNHDNVRLFDVTHPTESGFINGNPEKANLVYAGYYNSAELYKTITKDENWQPASLKNHTTEEFKNKQGQVVLKRTYDNTIAHDTYYIYDDFGNLTYVLSPEGSKEILDSNNNIKQSVLDELCYQYLYDYRNRLVEKKIPHKGWEYIVYDKLDRPVLTQDANLRLADNWLFTKYDALDRVAYTGRYNFDPIGNDDNSGRLELQASLNSTANIYESRIFSPITINGTDIYYSNTAKPKLNLDIYKVNYYDDYNWDTGHTFEASYNLTDVSSGLSEVGNTITKTTIDGLSEGFKTEATIEGDGYIQWTVSQNDKKHMIGLSQINSAPNNSYVTIDYGIFLKEDGFVRIYEEGVYQNIQGNITYNANDVFKVERTFDQIRYYKNDIAIHASYTPSTGELIGDSWFYSEDTIVEDVFVGYSSLGQPFTSNTKGLSTGSKIRILDTNQWTISSTYYDEKARPIYSISENDYLVTIDAVSSYFDFSGKVIKTHSTHSSKNNKSVMVTIDDFRYDHTGRLLRHEQKINNEDKELIAKNNYDELGQLEQKQVGGAIPSISTYVGEQGVSTSTNTITKTATTGWSNSGLSTVESILGDGYVSFTTTQSARSFMCGLAYTDTDLNWTSINYAIYLQWGGDVSIRESGANRGVKTTHVPGDTFLVERRGSTIYYLKNGEPFYVSEVQATTASMIGGLSIYDNGTTIKNLVIVDLEQELQEIDYTYNIRGWLKTINDVDDLSISGSPTDLFGFKINYNTNDLSGAPLFNGNISETLWNTASVDPINQEFQIKRGYDYTYDALNRIQSADFHKLSGVNHDDYYNLNTISYDRNGNILTLARSGVSDSGTLLSTMDNLTYTYNGNQLTDILESGDHNYGFIDAGNTQTGDYLYDANGNMTADYNKGILISYNHLNLPTSVIKSSQELITYTYDATGVKLSKSVTTNSNTILTEYANSFIYEDGNLEFFSHPEGYIEDNGSGGFDYVYQYKDHLGNIRLSYSDSDQDGLIDVSKNEIIEENNYYPFGLKHKGYNNVVTSTNPALKKKFGGKEYQDELDLGWYDITARNYDPAIGRWFNIDPLAETYMPLSPYNFTGNNPVLYVDDNGKDFTVHNEKNKDGEAQIRISATYYVKKGDEKSKDAAEKGANYWNEKSNQFSLETKNEDGEVSSSTNIVFDLIVVEVDDPQAEMRKDYQQDDDAITKDGSSNTFTVVDDESITKVGTTGSFNKIKLTESNANTVPAAHEMGHTLGLKDKGTNSSSIMSGGYTGSSGLSGSTILQILNFAEENTTPRKINVNGNIPKGTHKRKRKQRKVTKSG